MSINQTKQRERIERTSSNYTVTNPLKVGAAEYKPLKRMYNIKQICDKGMFVVLTGLAIYAFYSALISLML